MLSRLIGKKNEVDLAAIKFDAANAEHIAALSVRIDSFNDAVRALVKTDVIIVVPVTCSLLLWLTGTCGTVIETSLLAGYAAILWATNILSQREVQYKVFQDELNKLLIIYTKCIADHGYQIMANENCLILLQTVAPYVETHQLWVVRDSNPTDYPAGFKKALSTAPHRVPFSEGKPDTVNGMVTAVADFVGLSSVVPSATSVIQKKTGGVIGLFSNVAADTRKTMYGHHGKEAMSFR